MPPAVAVDRLVKRFGGRVAVREVSFEVRDGEVMGLLGHNGAGKSSVIGCLLGQVFPTSGAVRIFGHDVRTDRDRALAHVGAIFETPCFYDYLSGWDNLAIFTSFSGGVNESERRETVELLGLSARIHDRVGVYSHGMRQRLALAQALLPRPRLLVLDEPADGLDPEGIAEIREWIARLNREMGMTILLCSHQLHEVEQLCDRVAVLREGELLFCGDWRTEGGGADRLEITGSDAHAVIAYAERAGWLDRSDGGLVAKSDDAFAQVVAHVAAQKARVNHLSIRRPTLEEAYLHWRRHPASLDDGLNGQAGKEFAR